MTIVHWTRQQRCKTRNCQCFLRNKDTCSFAALNQLHLAPTTPHYFSLPWVGLRIVSFGYSQSGPLLGSERYSKPCRHQLQATLTRRVGPLAWGSSSQCFSSSSATMHGGRRSLWLARVLRDPSSTATSHPPLVRASHSLDESSPTPPLFPL